MYFLQKLKNIGGGEFLRFWGLLSLYYVGGLVCVAIFSEESSSSSNNSETWKSNWHDIEGALYTGMKTLYSFKQCKEPAFEDLEFCENQEAFLDELNKYFHHHSDVGIDPSDSSSHTLVTGNITSNMTSTVPSSGSEFPAVPVPSSMAFVASRVVGTSSSSTSTYNSYNTDASTSSTYTSSTAKLPALFAQLGDNVLFLTHLGTTVGYSWARHPSISLFLLTLLSLWGAATMLHFIVARMAPWIRHLVLVRMRIANLFPKKTSDPCETDGIIITKTHNNNCIKNDKNAVLLSELQWTANLALLVGTIALNALFGLLLFNDFVFQISSKTSAEMLESEYKIVPSPKWLNSLYFSLQSVFTTGNTADLYLERNGFLGSISPFFLSVYLILSISSVVAFLPQFH